MALVAAVLFAANGTVSKIVLGQGVAPGQLLQLRVTGAAIVIAVILAVTRPSALKVRPSDLGGLVLYGVVGVSLVQWLYLVAIGRLPVGIALLIEYTSPLLVALWVRFVRGESVRRRIWVALVLCLGGLALVGQVGAGAQLDRIGLLAAVGAAFALTTYFLTSERALAGRDAMSLATYGFAFSAVVWSVIHPWWRLPVEVLTGRAPLPGPLAGMDAPVALLVAWVIVFGTVAPFLLVLWGIGFAGSTRIALVGTSEPVLAGMVAWVVLGEALGGIQLVGVVVVVVGIVLATTARGGPDAPRRGAQAVGAQGPGAVEDDGPPRHPYTANGSQ
jgi:drug/metabolite transporter (DMT)-like permease